MFLFLNGALVYLEEVTFQTLSIVMVVFTITVWYIQYSLKACNQDITVEHQLAQVFILPNNQITESWKGSAAV